MEEHGATLVTTNVAHGGAERVTREQLVRIPAPEPTKSWKPVAHAELIDTIAQEVGARGLVIKREQFAVQRGGSVLFAAFDFLMATGGVVRLPEHEYGMAMAVRHGNDKSMAIQIAAGARVFICDNMALEGELIAFRKHTSGLSLRDEVNRALDAYLERSKALTAGIEQLKVSELTDGDAKQRIYDVFSREILPVTRFHDVANNYFHAVERQLPDCEPRTAWGLHNACTRVIKEMNPAPAFRATIDLGGYFGLRGRSAQN